MKNISTGTGIALLAGAIVAYPILDRVMPKADASATHAAAVVAAATAQSQRTDVVPVGPQPRVNMMIGGLTKDQPHDPDGVALGDRSPSAAPKQSMANRAMTTACPPASWFDQTPRRFIDSCTGSTLTSTIACIPLSTADVNSDGLADVFVGQAVDVIGMRSCYGGFNCSFEIPATVHDGSVMLQYQQVVQSQTATALSLTPVFPASVGEQFLGVLPDLGAGDNLQRGVQLLPIGWIDCDDDRAMDLVCQVTVWKQERSWSSSFCGPNYYCWDFVNVEATYPVWFKNTGFLDPHPVASDLNHDGGVDGADLGLLLASWGPNR